MTLPGVLAGCLPPSGLPGSVFGGSTGLVLSPLGGGSTGFSVDSADSSTVTLL